MVETTEDIKIENFERFGYTFEPKGCYIILDGKTLCFLTKKDNEHLKLTSKRAKFYNSLNEIGEKDLFSIEIAIELKDIIDKEWAKERSKKHIKDTKEETKEDIVEPNEEIDSWERLAEVINRNMYDREEEFKFVMACVISLWFHENDFIFLLVVARRGEGKSTILKSFDGSCRIHSVDTFSANALAPGLASIGDERYNLLEKCKNKTLIIHDMSASLSLPDQVKVKVLGEFTNSYDEDGLSKFSPGAGDRRYGGAYNLIGGITHGFLQSNWKDISNTGRFLYYNMRELDFEKIVRSELVPNSKELNAAVKGYLWNLDKKYKELTKDGKKIKFNIYSLGIDMMIDFFKVYEKYLQVVSIKNEKGKYEFQYNPLYHVENPNRRYRQALMLMRAMAFLEGKTKINFNNFEGIKQIFLGIDNKTKRKQKLELINKEDLPNFQNKKWDRYTLFNVKSKKDLERITELSDIHDEFEPPELPEYEFEIEFEPERPELEPTQPDYPDEPPEEEIN